MEQNKLEKQIKEKLNLREIQPSAQAWDRLDAILSVTDEKKSTRNFKWLYIAASFIGFTMVGLFFYNQENSATDINLNNKVVETTIDVEKVESKSEVFPKQEKTTQKAVGLVHKTEVNVLAQQSKETRIEKSRKERIQEFVKIENENTPLIAQEGHLKIEEKIEIKINSTTAIVSVENILGTSEKQAKPKLKIDPKALLSQVDGEIELTFREKVIKSINKNYDNARLSLASRNQE
ncbi:hypothetical protein [Flavobacterium sp.]|uniref:hypothetical protein n=1 Tax=Flavobacterium sp. TaxID=239 RepID=UPI00286E96AA|nr:hypothetical protein [Flavobacterium sp.]